MKKEDSFNAYEKALIVDKINPKVCYLSSTNSEYLHGLKEKYGANISMLGINLERIDLSNFNNCDIVILETNRCFCEAFYNFFVDLSNIISYKENRNVSMVYSFSNSDGSTKVCSFNSISWMYKDMNTVDGEFESRDLLDIGSRLYFDLEKEKTFVKSHKLI